MDLKVWIWEKIYTRGMCTTQFTVWVIKVSWKVDLGFTIYIITAVWVQITVYNSWINELNTNEYNMILPTICSHILLCLMFLQFSVPPTHKHMCTNTCTHTCILLQPPVSKNTLFSHHSSFCLHGLLFGVMPRRSPHSSCPTRFTHLHKVVTFTDQAVLIPLCFVVCFYFAEELPMSHTWSTFSQPLLILVLICLVIVCSSVTLWWMNCVFTFSIFKTLLQPFC